MRPMTAQRMLALWRELSPMMSVRTLQKRLCTPRLPGARTTRPPTAGRTKLAILATLTALVALTLSAAQAEPLRLSVLMHSASGSDGEAGLRAALESVQAQSPAFVVVNGLKGKSESCSDRLFRRRKAVLEAADVPVFLSMAGSDWIDCRDRRGRPAESVWLSLLREQLYGDVRWNGSKHLRLRRQSALPAFRSYAENTRWSTQQVMFATLHLPAPNNHYVSAAGRNSEFEDRLTANRDWLKRLSQHATAERHKAIVLFCDGRLWPSARLQPGVRDGFREMRSALRAFADKVRVPVLLVQGPGTAAAESSALAALAWRGNFAQLSLPVGITHLEVDTDAAMPFALSGSGTDQDGGASP